MSETEPISIPRSLTHSTVRIYLHAKHYVFTVMICFAIAVLIWAATGDSFLECLVFSLCIGLSVHTFTSIGLVIFGGAVIWRVWAASIPLGVIFGLSIGGLINGFPITETVDSASTIMSIVISVIATYIFISYYSMIEMREKLRLQELNQVVAEKRLIETQLRLLQSQIEPHFLFNTLSHVVSLISVDAERAEVMLQKLTQFLRASLRRSRSENTSLQDEIDLLSDYLAILKVRMGDRLDYRLDVEVDATAIRLPPLLLQPLVENAVIHGLEPLEGGGSIAIGIRNIGDHLVLAVSDTGRGLGHGGAGAGMGINNVRERLRMLYGAGAKLELRDVAPCGLDVRISIPREKLK